MKRESFQRPNRRYLRTYLIALICVFVLNISVFPHIWPHLRYILGSDSFSSVPSSQPSNKTLVPLEAHIMSKCPDAKDCLVNLVVPAMEKVVDQVDFSISYIGSISSDDTVQCMHGPDECLGDMLSLCAQQLFPRDPKRSLGFTNCMIMQYPDIPKRDLVEECALEHGISFDDINTCISDEGRGTGLLEASVSRSKDAGVVKSCTVRLAEKIWCIRDGGQWKNCSQGHEPSDLADAVKSIADKN